MRPLPQILIVGFEKIKISYFNLIKFMPSLNRKKGEI